MTFFLWTLVKLNQSYLFQTLEINTYIYTFSLFTNFELHVTYYNKLLI